MCSGLLSLSPVSVPALQRTVRRVGATLAVLLAFTVLYLDRFVQDWQDPVVPDTLAILLPWTVVLVALGYLTVSLLAGLGRWLAPESQDNTEGSADPGKPAE